MKQTWNPLGVLTARCTGDEGLRGWFYADRFAWDGRYLYGFSAVGSSTQVKALRAAIMGNTTIEFGFRTPSESPDGEQTYVGIYKIHDKAYTCPRPVRIGESSWHVAVLIQYPGFMIQSTDEALWQWMRTSTTTPAIREWVPAVAEALTYAGKLRKLSGFNCEPAVCSATDEDLDGIVSQLMQTGRIQIPGRKAS